MTRKGKCLSWDCFLALLMSCGKFFKALNKRFIALGVLAAWGQFSPPVTMQSSIHCRVRYRPADVLFIGPVYLADFHDLAKCAVHLKGGQ